MKVRIKSGHCPSYLTVGKAYDACRKTEYSFNLLSDNNGHVWSCSFNNCIVLNGGSWEIVDE